MKGGGSIQYSLLTRYSEDPDFEGNVIVLGVPDEENLSAGMRGAILLLNELKEKYGLEYEFMFNSEPHQRKDFSKAVFSCGSIGKLMPFVYIRGFLAHVGKSFEGLNPVGIMGDVVSGLELNMDLADAYAGECAPGPTWLYLKDSKISYDVSMPLNMYGCPGRATSVPSATSTGRSRRRMLLSKRITRPSMPSCSRSSWRVTCPSSPITTRCWTS